jgi:hypothetical protein
MLVAPIDKNPNKRFARVIPLGSWRTIKINFLLPIGYASSLHYTLTTGRTKSFE